MSSDDARNLLLAGADEHDLADIDAYRALGGYTGAAKARLLTPEALIAEFETSKLRGRGGAGFPTGRKASLIDRASSKPTVPRRQRRRVRARGLQGPRGDRARPAPA